jgi:hypothetical protein
MRRRTANDVLTRPADDALEKYLQLTPYDSRFANTFTRFVTVTVGWLTGDIAVAELAAAAAEPPHD